MTALREPVEPRKCRKHVWGNKTTRYRMQPIGEPENITTCIRCGRLQDLALSRRGKQSRNYGNRAANKYGGTKIGAAGGPVIVVKKGGVMSEPSTVEDWRANMLAIIRGEMYNHSHDFARGWLTCDTNGQEARANADRELRELRAVADAARDLNMTMPDRGDTDPLAALDDALAALDAASERKS